jgi:hypothetical protein
MKAKTTISTPSRETRVKRILSPWNWLLPDDRFTTQTGQPDSLIRCELLASDRPQPLFAPECKPMLDRFQ